MTSLTLKNNTKQTTKTKDLRHILECHWIAYEYTQFERSMELFWSRWFSLLCVFSILRFLLFSLDNIIWIISQFLVFFTSFNLSFCFLNTSTNNFTLWFHMLVDGGDGFCKTIELTYHNLHTSVCKCKHVYVNTAMYVNLHTLTYLM